MQKHGSPISRKQEWGFSFFAQKILGHKSSKAIEIYTHLSTKNLSAIRSPLDYIVEQKRVGAS